MLKRNYIFDILKNIFQKYGFLPIETPSFENREILEGKSGDESDRLMFRILNSGNFMEHVQTEEINDSKKVLLKISEKALRYDLTVPFARFVTMNQQTITFPFKRYQIQPVWRADRPQKGRFREFYQCDIDVIGSDSLFFEAEILHIINEAFSALGILNFVTKINHRKILYGIIETLGLIEFFDIICITIDKIEKAGIDFFVQELKKLNIEENKISIFIEIFSIKGNNAEKINRLENIIRGCRDKACLVSTTTTFQNGIDDLKNILTLIIPFKIPESNIEIDFSLARGLSYYTGTIMETKIKNTNYGSVCGGGRYDNLTGVFGLPGVSGTGVSFGVERIFEVLNDNGLFPVHSSEQTNHVLIAICDKSGYTKAIEVSYLLRKNNIQTEILPSDIKLKKQLSYANSRKIPYVLLLGEREVSTNLFTLKNMNTGEQRSLNPEEVINVLKG